MFSWTRYKLLFVSFVGLQWMHCVNKTFIEVECNHCSLFSPRAPTCFKAESPSFKAKPLSRAPIFFKAEPVQAAGTLPLLSLSQTEPSHASLLTVELILGAIYSVKVFSEKVFSSRFNWKGSLLSTWRSTKCQAVHASDPVNPKASFGEGPKSPMNFPRPILKGASWSYEFSSWCQSFGSIHPTVASLTLFKDLFVKRAPFLTWSQDSAAWEGSLKQRQPSWGKKRALAIFFNSIAGSSLNFSTSLSPCICMAGLHIS